MTSIFIVESPLEGRRIGAVMLRQQGLVPFGHGCPPGIAGAPFNLEMTMLQPQGAAYFFSRMFNAAQLIAATRIPLIMV
jgi:hypothetical protein